MDYLGAYSFFLSVVSIFASLVLAVSSVNHYILLERSQFIYQSNYTWYMFSSSGTVLILGSAIVIWSLNIVLPLLGFGRGGSVMGSVHMAMSYLDSLTISISILWITHLFIESTMQYPDEYQRVLSESMVLYILVLSVRLPLFITIDVASSVKNHINGKPGSFGLKSSFSGVEYDRGRWNR